VTKAAIAEMNCEKAVTSKAKLIMVIVFSSYSLALIGLT